MNNQEKIKQLKPCPFCGGEASIYNIPEFIDDDGAIQDGEIYVLCLSCKAVTNPWCDFTVKQSIEAWNTRADDEAIDDMHEQGHLTSSEKPTHSIPEGMCLVPVELTEGIRRCIENLMFAYGYDGEPIPELEDKFYKALIKTAKSEGE